VANNVFQAIAIDILWKSIAKGQAFFISCGPEGEGFLIYLTGSIKVFCRENGNGDPPHIPGINAVGVPPWFDVDGETIGGQVVNESSRHAAEKLFAWLVVVCDLLIRPGRKYTLPTKQEIEDAIKKIGGGDR
jgi:hypothetical protein